VPQPSLVEPLRRWDPEQVGGYVLIGRLGAGAMGQVYLGRSPAGRLVAVKTIKAELAEEPVRVHEHRPAGLAGRYGASGSRAGSLALASLRPPARIAWRGPSSNR
jgi:serine/threonine protein kinase